MKNKLSEINHLIKLMLWNYKFYFSKYPGLTLLRTVTLTITEARGLINSAFIAIIIDDLISLLGKEGSNISDLIPSLALLILANLLLAISQVIRGYADSMLRIYMRNFEPYIALYTKLHSLGTASLESPRIQDLSTRFRENMYMFENLFINSLYIVALSVIFLISTVSLVNIIPIFIPLVLIASIPRFTTNSKYIKKLWQLDKSVTSDSRKAYNSVSSLTQPKELKEVSITSSFQYIKSIFMDYYRSYTGKYNSIRKRWTLLIIVNNTILYGVIGFGYILLFNLALKSEISVGAVSFYMSAIGFMTGTLSGVVSTMSNLSEGNEKFKDLKELLDAEPEIVDGNQIINTNNNPPKIELQNLSFTYPRSKKSVIKNLNLEIQPGEKIAIVGENGAGKTTLIKLLTRLYKASDGAINVNGVNLNDIKLESWYENLGVLFQDFNQYEDLSAFENIALGRMPEDKETIDYDKIKDAAKKADAHEFIMEYENNYSQVLSEKYEGGIRPSGGQWQKIAIARFFYRNAPLLILDEPTAAIDAVAEANIFDRIYKFIEDKTVIIISHRFSTVRNADRIIVFDKGQIAEEGTHEELLSLNGKYATAFRLQAEGYN